ncbi:MAG: hypothetical protein ABEJ34_03605 [Haloferacaceae archaeon]
MTTGETPSIQYDSENVTQGQNLRYEIQGSEAGDQHTLTIEPDDFRNDDFSADTVAGTFRNVGDTDQIGIVVNDTDSNADSYVVNPGDIDSSDQLTTSINSADNSDTLSSGATISDSQVQYAFAQVTVDDDGLGVGEIETDRLDTTSVTTNLYADGEQPAEPANSTLDTVSDDQFTVEEGEITLDTPGSTYVAGAEVDVNGTAPAQMDAVSIYVRDEGSFELVNVSGSASINVDGDGTFTEQDVNLASGGEPGNNLLNFPGTIRIGAIDAQDADLDNNGTADSTLSTQEFNQGTSSQRSLRVVDQALTASFPSTVRGQIAEADNDVDVSGTATGADNVLFVAVGQRGNVVTQDISVESDDIFNQEDIDLSSLPKGQTSLHVISIARDGDVGDGDLPSPGGNADSIDDLQAYVDSLDESGNTAQQVRSKILDETTEATASDDLIVSQTVRITDAQTSINSVYQQGRSASGINPVAVGNTMVVEGTTNLSPATTRSPSNCPTRTPRSTWHRPSSGASRTASSASSWTRRVRPQAPTRSRLTTARTW